MATTKHPIFEDDVVVLREPPSAWPAGPTGAVVSTYDDTLLVEITGPGGKALDTIEIAAAQLALKRRLPHCAGRARTPSRLEGIVQALIAIAPSRRSPAYAGALSS